MEKYPNKLAKSKEYTYIKRQPLLKIGSTISRSRHFKSNKLNANIAGHGKAHLASSLDNLTASQRSLVKVVGGKNQVTSTTAVLMKNTIGRMPAYGNQTAMQLQPGAGNAR